MMSERNTSQRALPPKPLRGLGIVVTRPAHQAESLAQRLEAEGATVVRFPGLEIQDLESKESALSLIAELSEFSWAIFVSANAVERGVQLVRLTGKFPRQLKFAAVGSSTARTLEAFGIGPVLHPTNDLGSEGLLAMPELNSEQIRGKRIVIFRGEGGRELLGNVLRERGARVDYAEVYRRVQSKESAEPLLRRGQRGEVDVCVVTSGDGLRSLYSLVGASGREWLRDLPLVVVSERMANLAHELGARLSPIVAKKADDEGITEALKHWRSRERS